MYKDIETKGMSVACSVQDKCSGDKLMPPPPPAPAVPIDQTIAPKSVKKPSEDARHKAKQALPKKMPPPSITPEEVQVTKQTTEELEENEGKFVDPTSIYHGGRKKKKKRRKKRSRSKKRRNKRKNRTKKN